MYLSNKQLLLKNGLNGAPVLPAWPVGFPQCLCRLGLRILFGIKCLYAGVWLPVPVQRYYLHADRLYSHQPGWYYQLATPAQLN